MDTQPRLPLLLTRPLAQSKDFARRVEAEMPEVWDIEIAPVMEIRDVGEMPDLEGADAVIFTSRNGVERLVARGGARDMKAITIGEQTTNAARGYGFEAEMLGQRVADLVAAMKARAAGRFVHVCGAHVAGNLAERLGRQGHEVQQAVIYDQAPLALDGPVRDALAAGQYRAVPLFSPRSAHLLFEAAEVRPGPAFPCFSPAVADVVPPALAAAAVICETPDAEAMLRRLRAIADR